MDAPATTLRLQCSTGPFWSLELEAALDAAAEAGFDEVELMVWRDPRTQEPERPMKLAEERGLRIGAVHGPFLALTKSVWSLDPLEKIRRGIDFCQTVGADALIVHPPYLWERDYARWIQTEAKEAGAAAGVKITVETMYPKWVRGRRLRAHRWTRPAELVEAAPWVVIDTSHLAIARQDIVAAYRTLAPKLTHVHLSNSAGDGRDRHLELDQGVLDMDAFLEELLRTEYGGVVTLELSVARYLDRPKDLVEMLRRNREHVQQRLARGVAASRGRVGR